MRFGSHATVFALLGVAVLAVTVPPRTPSLAGDGKPPAKAGGEAVNDPWVGEFRVYESGHLNSGERVYWPSNRHGGTVTVTRKGEAYRISAGDGVELSKVKNRLEPADPQKHPKWVELGEKDPAGRPTLVVMFTFHQIFLVRDKAPAGWKLIAGEGKPGRPAPPPAAKLSNWKIARSYELDGVSDHVRVDDHPDLRPAALTISAWVYTLDAKRMQPIVAKASAKGNWVSYMVRIQGNGKLSFVVGNHTAEQEAHWQTDDPLATKKWHHIAATWANAKGDATDAKIYIDGVPQQIAMSRDVGYGRDFRIAYTAEPLYIGRDEMPSGHFAGKIKDVDVLARVLTAAEIKALAEEPQP